MPAGVRDLLKNLNDLEKGRVSNATFVREIFASADPRCGRDIVNIEKEYRDEIGQETANRISTFDETYRDIAIAHQAVFHLHDRTVEALTKGLTWPSYFRYCFR